MMPAPNRRRFRPAAAGASTDRGAHVSAVIIEASPELPNSPSRKTIRSWLLPLSQRNTAYALALVALDLCLFGAALALTVAAGHPLLKLLAGMAAGFFIGRLFILGHDACHQSFTSHRRLNRWIGRLVFLPSLTPYSLWDTGHNVVHHGYTNLRGVDFVWQPHSLDEYRAMPRVRRWLERAYRSGWAPWLYYLVEIWWRRMFFPSRREMPSRRRIFLLDCLLVSGFALLWIAGLVFAASATGQSPLWTVLFGFVVPFVFWNGMIGFVVYVHHTHPSIVWHEDKAQWSHSQPFVSTTVHMTFRRWMGIDVGAALHHIMEHTAHHVDMGIPLYRLRAAQAVLEQKLPGRIVVQAFSWRWYFDTASRCKLYDFAAKCWTDFSGRPTSAPTAMAGAA
jgi:omega-6 fatty acid desaturase (delta-12 desaturase)